jgi:hypothetical protein
LIVNETSDAGEEFDVVVFPDAEILRADAGFRKNGGCFGENEAGPAYRAAAEMDKVSVVGESVGAGVLAHGRNEDAIREGEVTNLEGIEQMRHR